MKNYQIKDYKNYKEFEQNLINDFKKDIINKSITSKTYQQCIITNLKDVSELSNGEYDIMIEIQDTKTMKSHLLMLQTALTSGSLVCDSKLMSVMNYYLTILLPTASKYYKALHTHEMELMFEEIEKEKEKKELLKLEIIKKRLIKKFKKDINTKTYSTTSSIYPILGWIAKHATNFHLSIPHSLENLTKQKIDDYDENSLYVASGQKGASGYYSQWSYSAYIVFDTLENCPSMLLSKIKQESKQFTDTSFIFYLVNQFDFKFKHKQNLEEIMSGLTIEQLQEFKKGYSL